MNQQQLLFNRAKNSVSIPWYVQIEITEACKASCSQCYVEHSKARNMDFKLYTEIVQQLGRMGVASITLTGGDPVQYPYLVEAVAEAKQHALSVIVVSSGIGVNPALCDRLIEAGLDEFHISLNGSTAEINNRSRSNYSDAIKAIQIITQKGIPCTTCWVARKDNYFELQNYIALCKRLGISRIFIQKNKKTMFGVVEEDITGEIIEIADILREYYNQGYITIDACFPELHEQITHKKVPLLLRKCTGGVNHFEILVDGSLSPCRKTKITE